MTSRPLTDGEIKLAKSVFGDAIDYKKVSINDRHWPVLQKENFAWAMCNTLYMHKYYEPDFSQASPHRRGLFIHEMAHIWQWQNRLLKPVGNTLKQKLKQKFNYKAYPFTLDAKKDLMNYGIEQQAAMIQEYYLNKRAGLPSHKRHCENTCSHAERHDLYEKVLEKFLKNPSYIKRRFPKIF